MLSNGVLETFSAEPASGENKLSHYSLGQYSLEQHPLGQHPLEQCPGTILIKTDRNDKLWKFLNATAEIIMIV